MDNNNKGRSPFYPGQPVPVDLFVGRKTQVQKILRSIEQVELGKPQAVFLAGEYGIGKSSLAAYMKRYAEEKHHLFGIHVLLGGAKTVDDVAAKTVEAAIKSEAYEPTVTEKVRYGLSKYVGKQSLFGVNVNFEALKADGPNISHGYLPFLRGLLDRLKENNIKGIMLILDELNGITADPNFAHFIKSLIDENALSKNPLPMLLMLCGVEERRSEMIRHHEPIARIFDVVDVEPMDDTEMKDFFNTAFNSAGITVDEEAMWYLCLYSAGFPKVMHIIGDAAFWLDKDNKIDENDSLGAVVEAANEIGRKFVDQQIYKALRSPLYHAILTKLGKEFAGLSFKKESIEKGLSAEEKKNFNNFLQRMKELNVLKSGEERGEYIFNSLLVKLYIRMNPIKKP
ncbi:MAG: ATP-binding protein [Deltaproteobacteria bacterium]|nr:ATP-binding protein [Deltaproteobacteria bacterium]